MPAGSYNFTVDQGATLLQTITWTQPLTPEQSAAGDTVGSPVDLTNFAAHMQVRSQAGATDLELDLSTVNYDGGTGNGYIVLGNPEPTDGTININVPSEVMAAVPAGGYKYDLDLFSDGATPIVTKLLGGTFKVTAAVSIDVGE
jgi:hypothetical protein